MHHLMDMYTTLRMGIAVQCDHPRFWDAEWLFLGKNSFPPAYTPIVTVTQTGEDALKQ